MIARMIAGNQMETDFGGESGYKLRSPTILMYHIAVDPEFVGVKRTGDQSTLHSSKRRHHMTAEYILGRMCREMCRDDIGGGSQRTS